MVSLFCPQRNSSMPSPPKPSFEHHLTWKDFFSEGFEVFLEVFLVFDVRLFRLSADWLCIGTRHCGWTKNGSNSECLGKKVWNVLQTAWRGVDIILKTLNAWYEVTPDLFENYSHLSKLSKIIELNTCISLWAKCTRGQVGLRDLSPHKKKQIQDSGLNLLLPWKLLLPSVRSLEIMAWEFHSSNSRQLWMRIHTPTQNENPHQVWLPFGLQILAPSCNFLLCRFVQKNFILPEIFIAQNPWNVPKNFNIWWPNTARILQRIVCNFFFKKTHLQNRNFWKYDVACTSCSSKMPFVQKDGTFWSGRIRRPQHTQSYFVRNSKMKKKNILKKICLMPLGLTYYKREQTKLSKNTHSTLNIFVAGKRLQENAKHILSSFGVSRNRKLVFSSRLNHLVFLWCIRKAGGKHPSFDQFGCLEKETRLFFVVELNHLLQFRSHCLVCAVCARSDNSHFSPERIQF